MMNTAEARLGAGLLLLCPAASPHPQLLLTALARQASPGFIRALRDLAIALESKAWDRQKRGSRRPGPSLAICHHDQRTKTALLRFPIRVLQESRVMSS